MAGNKSVTLDVLGRNADAIAKIDQVKKDYEELKAEVDAGNLDLSPKQLNAAYQAQLRSAAKELFNVSDAAKNAGDELDNTRKKIDLFGQDARQGFLNAAMGVTGFGDAVALVNPEASMAAKVFSGLSLATGTLEPEIAGLTVGMLSLTSGVASAGLGLGVFGLAATSAISQVSAANTAGTKLTGSLGELQTQLKGATTAWDDFGKSNASGVSSVLAGGIGLLPQLLKDVQPFLAPTEAALKQIVGFLSADIGSKGFISWMDSFAKASGPNLVNLGKSIINIFAGIGGVLKAFLPMSIGATGGFEKMTAAFAHWGETLSSHSGFQSLVSMAKQDAPIVENTFKQLAVIIKNVLDEMAGMSTFSNSRGLLEVLNPILTAVAKLSSSSFGKTLIEWSLYAYTAYSSFGKLAGVLTGFKDVATTVGNVSTAVRGLSDGFKAVEIAEDASNWEKWGNTASRALTGIKTGFGSLKAAVSAFDFTSLLNPWVLILTAVAVGVVLIIKYHKQLEAAAKVAWSHLKQYAADAWDWIKAHWPLVLGILIGPFGLAVVEIAKHWTEIRNGASQVVADIKGFFERLPADMVSIGENIVHGLINGILGMAGQIWSTVENLAKNYIEAPFKAALSIFSPSRVFAQHGYNIVAGLVQGIEGSKGLAVNSARNLGTSVAHAGAIAVAGSGASGGSSLTAEWVGGSGADAEFITWLKKNIRIRGGNPAVLGR